MKPAPLVILGAPTAPATSWWTDADLPRQLTAHVQRTHLERMQSSKFSLLEPFQVAGEGMPVTMKRESKRAEIGAL